MNIRHPTASERGAPHRDNRGDRNSQLHVQGSVERARIVNSRSMNEIPLHTARPLVRSYLRGLVTYFGRRHDFPRASTRRIRVSDLCRLDRLADPRWVLRRSAYPGAMCIAVDLHGLRVHEARDALSRVERESPAIIAICHGKGTRALAGLVMERYANHARFVILGTSGATPASPGDAVCVVLDRRMEEQAFRTLNQERHAPQAPSPGQRPSGAGEIPAGCALAAALILAVWVMWFFGFISPLLQGVVVRALGAV